MHYNSRACIAPIIEGLLASLNTRDLTLPDLISSDFTESISDFSFKHQ